MDVRGGLFCRDCGQPLPASRLDGARETKVLGEAYCDACLEARAVRCHRCGGGLRVEDFDEGRAATVAGLRYCQPCLKEAVDTKSREAPAPVESAEGRETTRRRHGRFLPGKGASLSLRGSGLGGLLRGERVRVWLDVCEAGFRAILSGSVELESRLGGQLLLPDGAQIAFEAIVRHVRSAASHPGCVLAGCEFENPAPALVECIRATMAARPVRLPGAAEAGRS